MLFSRQLPQTPGSVVRPVWIVCSVITRHENTTSRGRAGAEGITTVTEQNETEAEASSLDLVTLIGGVRWKIHYKG